MDEYIGNMLFGIDLDDLTWLPVNMFLDRETVEKLLQKLEKHMINYCYYFSNCQFCKENKIRRDELKRMGFWTHNKTVKCWNVYDPLYNKKNEKCTVLPLEGNFKNGVISFHRI